MAARLLLHPLRTPTLKQTLLISSSLLASGSILHSHLHRRPLFCDAPPIAARYADYERDAKVPVIKRGKLNPSAIGQLSAGSITGLLGGMAVGVFSKSLAFLIGLLVLGVQTLESRGLHIIPYERLQKWFTNTDIKSAVQDNVAFKLSFGTTFLLASFAEF